jgi:thymidylate synthase
MNKIELHETAVKILKLIKYARYKKDTLYDSYRKTFHIASKEYLDRMYHRIKIMDMVIERLKERYNKIMEVLCIL